MTHHKIEPWHRQFWPWFLIALPLTAVIGGIVTIWIAVNSQTGLISESYYQEGLSINEKLEQDRFAKQVQLAATILFSEENQLLTLHLTGDIILPDSLSLELASSFDANLDKHFQLQRLDQQILYQTHYSASSPGRYYLSIIPPDNKWRLKKEIRLPMKNPVHISFEKNPKN